MPIFANIIEEAFSPLINLFESIMVFIHAHLVGGSWGLAIVGLTILTRAVLVPLTFKQLRSMQEMQRMAPEINKLKEKYKDDKQRQQQEIMKFYQENKINPLASCLPFLLQLPVFISLFYMLRTDLKFDICGQQLREYYTRELHRPITKNSQIPEHAVKVAGHTVKGLTEVGCNVVAPGSAKFLFIPGHHLQGDGRRADRADRRLHRLADRLDADGHGHGRPQPAAHDAAAPARHRRVPVPVSRRTAGVLDHHQPVDDRAAVLHQTAHGTGSGQAHGHRRWRVGIAQRQGQGAAQGRPRRGHRRCQ